MQFSSRVISTQRPQLAPLLNSLLVLSATKGSALPLSSNALLGAPHSRRRACPSHGTTFRAHLVLPLHHIALIQVNFEE